MSKQANPAVVGAFVLLGLVIGLAGFLVISGMRMHERVNRCVIFFKGSLHGLSVGAPVTYKGVRIGRVAEITIEYDTDNREYLTPVFIEIQERDRKGRAYYKTAGFDGPEAFFAAMVAQGLRARLKLESLVTGKLYVELAFQPDQPATMVGMDMGCPELPGLPSNLQQLTSALEKLRLDELIPKAVSALEGLNAVVNDPDNRETLALLHDLVAGLEAETVPLAGELRQTLAQARGLMETTDSAIRETRVSIGPLITETRLTLGEARDLLSESRGLVQRTGEQLDPLLAGGRVAIGKLVVSLEAFNSLAGRDSSMPYRVDDTLREFRQTARSVRELADFLRRHPDALIRGQTTEEYEE